MKKTLGLLVFGLSLLFFNGSVFATAYQMSGRFSTPDHLGRTNGHDTALTVVNDPGDTNDAYAAVAEFGEQYALASIQGTHSSVKAVAKYQYGFTLHGAGNVDLEISYTLMAELFSIDQATVTTRALIGIYQYIPDHWGGSLTGGLPVWEDRISSQIIEPLPGVVYDRHLEKMNETAILTLPSAYQWGGSYRYVVELYAEVWALDTYYIQYQAGTYENPDAYYSAAAYADPTFTVLTPGASLSELSLTPQGSPELDGGTLDPPDKLPEPATLSVLALGFLAVLRRRRRH
jgi:hypothetical protein